MTDINAQELHAAYERGVATGQERERKRWEEAINKMVATAFKIKFLGLPEIALMFKIQWNRTGNELIGTVALLENTNQGVIV